MYRILIENLLRQDKAYMLLELLLKEEFSLLSKRDPEAVTSLEWKVHELTRQIIAEREVVRAMAPGRLAGLIRELPAELVAADMVPDLQMIPGLPEGAAKRSLAELLAQLLKNVDSREQRAVRQAEKNSKLALALMDQSQGMLQFLYDKAAPKEKQQTYSKQGAFKQARGEASLLRGRL